MVKSVTRANAEQDAPVRDNGAMPVMAGDGPYRDGESALPGGRAGSGRIRGGCRCGS